MAIEDNQDIVSYEEDDQEIVDYAATDLTPVVPKNMADPRKSSSVILDSGLPAKDALAASTKAYQNLEATGHDEDVAALEQADAEALRSEAVASELQAYTDGVSNPYETINTVNYILDANINGDAFAYTLPRLFTGLKGSDKSSRLEGIGAGPTPEARGEFVTRLSESEKAFADARKIEAIEMIIDGTSKDLTIGQAFSALEEAANEADDVLDWGLGRDIAILLLPFVSQVNWNKTYKDVTGKDAPLESKAWMGELELAIKEDLVNTPASARQAKIQEITEAIRSNSGLIGPIQGLLPEEATRYLEDILQNDAEAYFNLLAVADTNFMTDDLDWARWVDNAVTILDVATLGLGKMFKTGAKVLKRTSNVLNKGEKATAIRAMATTDQEAKAAEILSHALADPRQQANASIGMAKQDHVGALLPNIKSEEGYDLLPDYVTQVIARNEELAGTILDRRTRRAFYNNKEDQLVRDTVDAFNRNTGGQLQATRSQIGVISENEDSFEYIAQFGADASNGFKSEAEARQFVRDRLGSDAPVQVLKYDPAAGTYSRVNEGPTTGVEYVVRYPTKLHVPLSAADELDPMTGAYFNTTKNGWVANPATKLSEATRAAATRSVDDASLVQQRLNDILLPFNQLKRKDQADVIHLENLGASMAKDFTPYDLMGVKIDGRTLTPKQVAGYYSRLQHRKTMYLIENKALRKKMLSQNMKEIESPAYRGAGKYIPRDEITSKTWVYDATSGTVKELSKKEAHELYDVGGSIMESWRPITVDGHQVSKILVDGQGAKIKELPQQVLRYVPGYQPRYYNARWFVRKKGTAKVDGVEQEILTPIAGAEKYADAAAMVARQTDAHLYEITPDRVSSYGLADSESLNWELENLMFYNPRSELEIASLGSKNIIADPIEATSRSTNAVATALGQGQLREVLHAKFLNTYKSLLKKGPGGKPMYPERKSDILKPPAGDPKAFKLYREALAMHDYNRVLMAGLDPTQKAYRHLMLNVAATLEKGDNAFGRLAADALYGLTENFSPTALARNTAFTFQILSAPLRQAWIQSHQALFLTGIAPGITAKAFLSDAFMLDSMFALERAKVHNRKWLSGIAAATKEVTGVLKNTKEMENLYKNFSNSGMPYLRSALQLEDVSDKIRHTIGEFGYAAGERHNLAATYAFAYRKHLADTKKSWDKLTDSDWEKIAFDTREFSLNMTRADAFNYQHGIFSAATQYLAIRHKALNAVLSNKHFTPQQRVGIMAGQVLMFGVEGAGIGLVANSILEKMGVTYEDVEVGGANIPATAVKQAFEGGMYDLVANQTLMAMWDQEAQSDVQFARNMAALGEIDRLAASVFSGISSIDASKLAIGPASSVIPNIQRAMREVYYTTNSDLDTDEKVFDAVSSVISVFSAGSNILKATVGERLLLATDNKGKPIAEITPVDVAMRKLYGFGTSQEHEYYEGLYGNSVPQKTEQSTLDEAATILSSMIRKKTLNGKWEEARNLSGAIFSVWQDEYERAYIIDKVSQQLSLNDVANVEFYKKLATSWDLQTNKEVATKMLNDSYMLRNPDARNALKSFLNEEFNLGAND